MGERLTELIGPMWTSRREASDRRTTAAADATTAMGTEGNRPLDGGLDVEKYYCSAAGLDKWSCSMSTMMFNTIASFIASQQNVLLAGLGSWRGSGER